jgi:hypothetical protein
VNLSVSIASCERVFTAAVKVQSHEAVGLVRANLKCSTQTMSTIVFRREWMIA